MDPLIGKRLGKYEFQAEIGRGGMGIVYRGFDAALRRSVAIKVLPQQFTYDTQFIQRFQQEAVLAASLRHPGIVTIHDVGEQDGIHFIVMEYLEGTTLEGVIAQRGPLPLAQAGRILCQLADALDFAHGRGVIHRDVKPANVMVSPEGRATLMDFGLVRAAEGTSLTRSGTVMGTPEYMSPEQALGEHVDGRSDIYSLGIVLYKMLNGKVPFSRSTPYATTYAHIHEPPPPLRQAAPGAVPAPVDAVVTRALAKRPEERYQRAGLLADAFDAAIAGRAPAAVPEPRPAAGAASATRLIGQRAAGEKVSRGALPRWLLWLSGAALVLLAVAAIAWALSRLSGGEVTQMGRTTAGFPTVAAASSTTADLPAATSTLLALITPAPTPLATAGLLAVLPITATAIPAVPTARPTDMSGVQAASGSEGVPSPEAAPTATPMSVPRLTADKTVNVRSGPGTNYAAIGQLAAGETFEIIGKNPTGDWWQFDYNDRPGWVLGQVVVASGNVDQVQIAQNIPASPTPVPPPTVTPKPVACAIAPGPSFARLWDRNVLGCPTSDEFGLTTAYEAFEHGWMLWREDNNRHYAFFGDGTHIYYWYPSAEPPNFACPEAEALGRPRRGFSRVWCENPDVRAKIGNAVQDEIGDDRPVQEFENGFMIYIKERGAIASVYNSGIWAERP